MSFRVGPFRLWLIGLLLGTGSTAAAREVTFTKQTLTERFVAEGCAVADFDRDGHADITAGNGIWFGPDFATRVDFTPPADNPSGPSKTP